MEHVDSSKTDTKCAAKEPDKKFVSGKVEDSKRYYRVGSDGCNGPNRYSINIRRCFSVDTAAAAG
jgi:hypothetical protein